MITDKTQTLNKESYATPDCEVHRLQAEGIICLSGNGNLDNAFQDNWGDL